MRMAIFIFLPFPNAAIDPSVQLEVAMRIDPAAFRRVDLRVHAFLEDVPLHDVWRIELSHRDNSPDIRDVHRAVFGEGQQVANPIVKALFGFRAFLGRLFGWDRDRSEYASRSFSSRLTDDDRAASLEPPGSREGPFRSLYVFPNEALAEAINATVHAFSCFALMREEDRDVFYWAIYVRPGSARSRFYMALIDPFRRWVVYPSILRRIQTAWRTAPAFQ